MKMGYTEGGQKMNAYIVAGFTIVLCVILHFIYKIVFGNKKCEVQNREAESVTETSADVPDTTAAESRTIVKSKKRAPWKGKTDFSHPWLLKNLKGHPGTVLLMDFSANGKFMATTCDETNTTADPAGAAARRRRPRDRRRSPTAPPTPSTSLSISTEELVDALRPHLLSPDRMWALGYPLEIEPNSSKAVVYINPPPRPQPRFIQFDPNAKEFIPSGSQSDSGRGSWGSTPRSESDEEADAVEHLCVRCDKMFRMTREGEYVIEEFCVYHWGRISADSRYTCCNNPFGSKGCSMSRFHVWSGTKPGMNGPLEGYVRARSPRGGVYAVDTEMCYTTAGLELASIAVIAADGRLVYRSLVKPSSPVVDHNTRFSGIRPRDLARATKTLRDVQNDILGFVGSDTILIGHALENDLRSLKLLHGAVVDTSALYPHSRGFPFRRSLRTLSEELLGRSVQKSSSGHSPLEDARAAIDLVLLKVHEERAQRNRVMNQLPILQPYDPLICSDIFSDIVPIFDMNF